jgi:SAM-dependent methyltransferase
MASCSPDFGRTARDYARHRAAFPGELLDRLADESIVRAGMRVVDLGTGTGDLARLFARRGCEVVGIDIAPVLLEQARLLDREARVEVDYIEARAESTGLTSHQYELVSAGQCWHWFDRPAAAREVRRLLVEGGAIVIAHFDWLPTAGNLVAATEEIIMRRTPSWPFANGTGLYPRWLVDLQSAGFTSIETFSFDLDVVYSHEDWVGRVRASAPVAGTLDADEQRACSEELEAMIKDRFPKDPQAVPHRVWAVTSRAPAS